MLKAKGIWYKEYYRRLVIRQKASLQHSDHENHYPCAEVTHAPQRQSAEEIEEHAPSFPHGHCTHSLEAALGVTCMAAQHRGFTAQLSTGGRADKVDQVMGFLPLLITLYKLQNV